MPEVIWYRSGIAESCFDMTSGYSRERVRLSPDHVRRGLAMIDAGTVPGRGHEYVCDRRSGLLLRVTPTAATFYLKLETTTLRIGSASVLTLDQARDQASEAKIAAKRGKASRVGLQAYEDLLASGMSDIDAWEIAGAVGNAREISDEEYLAKGPWRWRDMRTAFLAHKEKRLKAGYFRLYRAYLDHPAFDTIAEAPVASLKLGRLEDVRNAIIAANKPSTAWRACQQAKECFDWAWQYHSGVSGLESVEYPWWQRLSVDYRSGARDHVPTLQDLARTLVLAETYRTLGWTEHATGAGTLGALWSVVLTAQRTGPLVGLRRDRLMPDPERPGWSVAVWEGSEMKGGKSGGRAHALPIPPSAMEIIERHWKEADGEGEMSAFAFPSVRGDGHVSKNSLNQLLSRLAGERNGAPPRKPAGRKKVKLTQRVDLLARHGIEPWTPHDVRRTLASFLDEARLGGAASAILAHRPANTEHDRERVEVVTRLHYAKSQRLGLKAEGMQLWVDAVLKTYRAEKAKMLGHAKAA